MARCGCGEVGSAAIRSLLSASDGVAYNSVTGHFTADISPNAGNNLTLDGFGRLYVPTGSATVNTGPGITGDGSGGNPVRANVNAWPYPTAPVTNAEDVFVDPATGKLKAPPANRFDYVSTTFSRSYASLPVNTSGSSVTADTFTVSLTNPDPNRPCLVIITREVKVRFGLPINSQASFAIDGVSAGRQWNFGNGSVTLGGLTVTNTFKSANLPANGSGSYTLDVGTLGGTGSSTYGQIDVAIRVMYLSF